MSKSIVAALYTLSAMIFVAILIMIYLAMPSLDGRGHAFIRANPQDPVLEDIMRPTAHFNVKFKMARNSAVQDLETKHRAIGAMAAKFVSLYPGKVEFYYDDGRDGIPQGHLSLGQETTTASYVGHVFYFTEYGNKNREIARFTMSKDQFTYFVEDPTRPPPAHVQRHADAERAFSAEYLNRTGLHWRHFYGPDGPRPPPSLYMWPANNIGDVHSVDTHQGYWFCKGNPDQCQSPEPLHLELEVISLAPRAFVIENFLSDFEVNAILDSAKGKLALSSVGDVDAGAFESDTRTSLNAWLGRDTSAVTDTLFRRAADLLQIDERLLHRKTNAEDLQVVHYAKGQKYDSHHDWGISGYPESRFITLLLYLNDMQSPSAGGETSFPHANNGKGIKVHPGKCNAVLFYNLLEDGNGDDLALHAALPLKEGEKWLANFWVWDPKFH